MRTIKGVRNDLNLSQREMAEKLDVPLASYQRYENYKAKIPVEVMDRIMELCGINSLKEIRYK